MFNETELTHFRARLQALERALLAIEEATDEDTRPVELDQARVGRLSRMDALQGQAMSLEVRRRRRTELRRIGAALRRLDKGDYGYCVGCGEPIAAARLEFDPVAAMCISCAAEAEKSMP